MAGHSKWANIQHRKGRQDKIRAKLFSKFSKEMDPASMESCKCHYKSELVEKWASLGIKKVSGFMHPLIYNASI